MRYLNTVLIVLTLVFMAFAVKPTHADGPDDYEIVCEELVVPFDDGRTDPNGHGTHVAGIIGAATNNGVGVSGVGYNTRILPVKVLNAQGSGDHASIASGIAWAADNGARIINLSLGGSHGTQTLQNAVDYATQRGALVVCAAGNAGTNVYQYPAAYPNCLSVVATDGADRRASFSSFGDTVDISAPGVGVLSTVRGGQYQAWNGTSMAAPNVSGVAALLLAANPGWTGNQLRQRLLDTADPIGPPYEYGRGRVNAERALSNNFPNPLPQPTATSVSPSPNTYASQVQDLINQARQQNGLGPLRYDSRLSDAAAFHNAWMRDHNCFAHECPGEPSVSQRMRNAGYPVISGGENIGKGYTTPQHMLDGWMNSSGHRAAILNTYWPDFGCAYLRGPSGHPSDSYWTCGFARGSDAPVATLTPKPYATPTPSPQPTVIVPPTRQSPRTVTPIAQPTPIRTPAPLFTPTPVPSGTLPPNWWMYLIIPVNAQTGFIRSAAYNEFCLGYAGRGVTCGYSFEWGVYAFVVTIDYDAAPYLAAHRAYWNFYEPFRMFFGVMAKWRCKSVCR